MSIFHDWRPREKDALNKALRTLEAKQPSSCIPMVKLSIYDGVVWCYDKRRWVVMALIDGRRKLCGSTRDEHKAPDMQRAAEKSYMSKSRQ